jgi:signal transduction histidine kinase/ActR/RegA family two-component response regulator
VPAIRFPSFRARILAFLLSLLLLVQLVAFIIVDAANTRNARQQVVDAVLAGGRIFDRLMASRTQQLADAARLLSGDFAFKMAYSTSDAGTVLSALQNHQARISADVMLLVSPDNLVIANTLHPRARQTRFAFPELIWTAEEAGEATAMMLIDGRPYQMVVVPLLAPVPVAWIGMGFLIDDELARDLERLAHVHVSFVGPRPGGGWSVPATSLPSPLRSVTLGSLDDRLQGGPETFSLSLEGREYVFHVTPLGGREGAGLAAVLQKSVDEALEPLYRLRATLIAILAGALLVSFACGVFIAKTVSRPVEKLVRGVRRIEKGDYGHRVTVDQQDELGELAAAINHMTVGIAQREEALRQSEEQLRQSQKMEAVGRLAGGIAHDFNNLLVVITGRAELLRGRVEGDEALGHDLQLITEAGRRASGLTQQLLAFSRKQILQPKVLDLNEVVAAMGTMLRRVIGEDVDLMIVVGANLGRVRADPGQLEQIIVNLVVNARDAMPKGGRLIVKTANVELDDLFVRRHSGARAGPHVMLSVSDTGEGIAAEVLPQIFEPFFTTKERGRGTGLGLSTVYGIVRQHDGSITVDSEAGLGTTFKIYLPRVEEAPESASQRLEPMEELRGSETVLLVEDEDGVRRLAREVLEMNGYTVLEAPDGSAALRMATRYPGPIHLLLTDVVMPHMNGRELGERLLALRPDLRVLYMSGYTDDAVIDRGLPESSMPFLPKPFAPVDLARKVRDVLQAAEAVPAKAGRDGSR